MLRKWENLPEYMKTDAVYPYYKVLRKKKVSLAVKRVFDFIIAVIMLTIFLPFFAVISLFIVLDSRGGVFFKQERVTQYGRKFKIYKFRTMVSNAEKIGTQVTVYNDTRITRVGKVLRKYRIDELPQLINIILGDMSFCGTRPESVHYVKKYSEEMFATLLLPAGVTSEASICYKDEAELLSGVENVDEVYVSTILPKKMKWNLESIYRFSLVREMETMVRTIFEVLG